MKEYKGKISPETAKKIISDWYDVWLEKINPLARTVEGLYWVDPDPFPGPPPYRPAGSFDGKVGDSEMAKI
jgi:hypothetical protein